MENLLKQLKNLNKSILIFNIIACSLEFIAAIHMFIWGEYTYYEYSSGGSSYHYYSYPESGIMPFFAFLLSAVAMFLSVKTYKKKDYVFLIGSFVLYCLSITLMGLAIFLSLDGMTLVFWVIGIVGAGLSFVSLMQTIPYLVLGMAATKLFEEQNLSFTPQWKHIKGKDRGKKVDISF